MSGLKQALEQKLAEQFCDLNNKDEILKARQQLEDSTSSEASYLLAISYAKHAPIDYAKAADHFALAIQGKEARFPFDFFDFSALAAISQSKPEIGSYLFNFISFEDKLRDFVKAQQKDGSNNQNNNNSDFTAVNDLILNYISSSFINKDDISNDVVDFFAKYCNEDQANKILNLREIVISLSEYSGLEKLIEKADPEFKKAEKQTQDRKAQLKIQFLLRHKDDVDFLTRCSNAFILNLLSPLFYSENNCPELIEYFFNKLKDDAWHKFFDREGILEIVIYNTYKHRANFGWETARPEFTLSRYLIKEQELKALKDIHIQTIKKQYPAASEKYLEDSFARTREKFSDDGFRELSISVSWNKLGQVIAGKNKEQDQFSDEVIFDLIKNNNFGINNQFNAILPIISFADKAIAAQALVYGISLIIEQLNKKSLSREEYNLKLKEHLKALIHHDLLLYRDLANFAMQNNLVASFAMQAVEIGSALFMIQQEELKQAKDSEVKPNPFQLKFSVERCLLGLALRVAWHKIDNINWNDFAEFLDEEIKKSKEEKFGVPYSETSNDETLQTDFKEEDIKSAEETLGVKRTDDQEKIKQVFRDKARLYHPDKGKEKDGVKFTKARDAYSLLMDYKKATGNKASPVSRGQGKSADKNKKDANQSLLDGFPGSQEASSEENSIQSLSSYKKLLGYANKLEKRTDEKGAVTKGQAIKSLLGNIDSNFETLKKDLTLIKSADKSIDINSIQDDSIVNVVKPRPIYTGCITSFFFNKDHFSQTKTCDLLKDFIKEVEQKFPSPG